MKPKLRIKFVDFWPGFVPDKCYFFDILGGEESNEISDNPQILFFSNFGVEHKKYNCFKVFFSSENERPNMFKCDIAFSFDFTKNKRHFRLPLFVLYAHQYKVDLINMTRKVDDDFIHQWKKRKFCCIVVSNGKAKERINFFNFLLTKEKIDSGGKFLNNVGGPVRDKLEFIEEYKFVISFENSKNIGYTTEKILEPFITNSIPIYWGNPQVHLDFNKDSYLEVSNSRAFSDVYKLMKRIESDDASIRSYLSTNYIIQMNSYLNTRMVEKFIITNFKQTKRTVSSRALYIIIARIIELKSSFFYWFKHYTIGHFR